MLFKSVENTNKTSFCKKWRTKGLSSWCIVERFKFTKHMNNLDIRHWYFDEIGVKTTDKEELIKFIEQQINYNILESECKFVKKHFNGTLLIGKNFKEMPDILRYCPECMSEGKHYIEQQILPLEYCMYHTDQKIIIGDCLNTKCTEKLPYMQLLVKTKEENHRMPFKCSCGHSLISTNNNGLKIYRIWNQAVNIDLKNKPHKTEYLIMNKINVSNSMYLELFRGRFTFNHNAKRTVKLRTNIGNSKQLKFKSISEFIMDFERFLISYLNQIAYKYPNLKTGIYKLIDNKKHNVRKMFDKALESIKLSSVIAKNLNAIEQIEDKYWLISHHMMNQLFNKIYQLRAEDEKPLLIKYDSDKQIIKVKYNVVK